MATFGHEGGHAFNEDQRAYWEEQAKIKGGEKQPTPVIDELKKQLSETNPYVCPKCGQPMAHYRLYGLKCMVCR